MISISLSLSLSLSLYFKLFWIKQVFENNNFTVFRFNVCLFFFPIQQSFKLKIKKQMQLSLIITFLAYCPSSFCFVFSSLAMDYIHLSSQTLPDHTYTGTLKYVVKILYLFHRDLMSF